MIQLNIRLYIIHQCTLLTQPQEIPLLHRGNKQKIGLHYFSIRRKTSYLVFLRSSFTASWFIKYCTICGEKNGQFSGKDDENLENLSGCILLFPRYIYALKWHIHGTAGCSTNWFYLLRCKRVRQVQFSESEYSITESGLLSDSSLISQSTQVRFCKNEFIASHLTLNYNVFGKLLMRYFCRLLNSHECWKIVFILYLQYVPTIQLLLMCLASQTIILYKCVS